MVPSNAEPIPGEILCESGKLELNAGRTVKKLTIVNLGDRPIQIGSHYHFFEVNRALQFDRAQAFGFRLDIPAGTAVRFEPGDSKEVNLVEISGERNVYGLNGLVNAALDSPNIKAEAVKRMKALGYGNVELESADGN